MMYTIIIFLITAALITLTIFSEKKAKYCRAFMYVNLALAVLGVALIIAAHVVATNQINQFYSESGFYSWASDFYELYYLISFPAFILLFITNVLAAIVSPTGGKNGKNVSKILRLIVSITSSVLLLLLPYYGLFTQNNSLKLYIYIMISGVGQALIIRLSDMLRLMIQIQKS